MTNKLNIRLAIAEDHELYREGLTARLGKEHNIEVVGQFENGKELLTFLKNNTADIVLMDIKMPELDGIKTTKIIMENYRDVKIIALTMHEDDNFIIEMLEAGARGYLLKNANYTEIITVIDDVFQGRRAYCNIIHSKILDLIARNKYYPHIKNHREDLNATEIEIIRLLCRSFSAKEIAGMMNLNFRTVEGYKSRLLTKFDVKTAIGIVIYAIKHKIVDINEL